METTETVALSLLTFKDKWLFDAKIATRGFDVDVELRVGKGGGGGRCAAAGHEDRGEPGGASWTSPVH